MNRFRKGRDKEFRIRKRLLSEGYHIVQRSAGSHSPIDVWAINFHTKEILLVQSKTNMTEAMKKKMELENHELNGTYTVKFVAE